MRKGVSARGRASPRNTRHSPHPLAHPQKCCRDRTIGPHLHQQGASRPQQHDRLASGQPRSRRLLQSTICLSRMKWCGPRLRRRRRESPREQPHHLTRQRRGGRIRKSGLEKKRKQEGRRVKSRAHGWGVWSEGKQRTRIQHRRVVGWKWGGDRASSGATTTLYRTKTTTERERDVDWELFAGGRICKNGEHKKCKRGLLPSGTGDIGQVARAERAHAEQVWTNQCCRVHAAIARGVAAPSTSAESTGIPSSALWESASSLENAGRAVSGEGPRVRA